MADSDILSQSGVRRATHQRTLQPGADSMLRQNEQSTAVDESQCIHWAVYPLRGNPHPPPLPWWGPVSSMTRQPSPSPHSQSCGRTVADPRGTGCQSWGVLRGTGWWSSCAERSVAARPSARWTGTGQGRELPPSGQPLDTHSFWDLTSALERSMKIMRQTVFLGVTTFTFLYL